MDYSRYIDFIPDGESFLEDSLFSAEKGVIYGLYEYLLSDKWGSNAYHMSQSFKNSMKLDSVRFIYNNIIVNSLNADELEFYILKTYVANLKQFIAAEIETDAFLEFGTPGHATVIYLKKNGNKICCTYINTGFGIDNNSYDYIYSSDGIEYYDLYKSITFDSSKIDMFVHTMLPFFYYKHCTAKSIEKYLFFIKNAMSNIDSRRNTKYNKYAYDSYDDGYSSHDDSYGYESHDDARGYGPSDDKKRHDLGLHAEYNEYYLKMYQNIYQNDKYFESLHEIFRTKKIEYVPDHLQIFEESDEMSDIHHKLVLSFDIYNRNIIVNDHDNITKKAFKNIICEIRNGKAYFMPQTAGSCGYKSLLMTWIIYCVFSPKYIPSMIYDKYVEYVNTFSLSIESIIDYYKLDKEGTCGSKLIEHMLEDNIIDELLIKKHNLHNFQGMLDFCKNEDITIEELPSGTEKIKINNIYDTITLVQILNGIRTKEGEMIIYLRKIQEFWDLYLSDGECANIGSFQTEIFIMTLLISYYYRKADIDGLIKNSDYVDLKIDIPSGRIELLEHERSWIGNILFSPTQTQENIYKSINLNKYFDLNYFLETHDFSSSYYKFHKNKMYFVSKYIIKINDTVAINYKYPLKIDKLESIVSFDTNKLIIEFIRKNGSNFVFDKTDDIDIITQVGYFAIQNHHIIGKDSAIRFMLNIGKQLIIHLKTMDDSDGSNESLVNGYLSSVVEFVNGKSLILLEYQDLSYVYNKSSYLDMTSYNRFDKFENGLVDMTRYDVANFEQIIINLFDEKTIDEIHEEIMLTNFTSNVEISHKNVRIVGGKYYITDGNESNECILCKTNVTYFFKKMGMGGYILNFYQLFCPANLKLYLLFNKDNYNYDKKILMSIQLIPNGTNYTMNYDEICIDGKKVINPIKNDIRKYPFMILLPTNCPVFITHDDKNDTYVTIIYGTWGQSYDNEFNEMTYTKLYKMYISKLKVKDNHLTLNLYDDKEINTKNYNFIRKLCSFHDIIIDKFKLSNIKVNNINTIIHDAPPLNTSILKKYNADVLAVHEILESWNKLIASDPIDLDLFNKIELLDAEYNNNTCNYCIDKSDLKTLSRDLQKDIYYDRLTSVPLSSDIKKFVKEHMVCNRININPDDVVKIRSYLDRASGLLKSACNSINYSLISNGAYTIIDHIALNYNYFYIILQINIYISKLSKILSLISPLNITCNELFEIDQLLTPSKIALNGTFEGCVQILLGVLIRDEQWEKYHDIVRSYTTGEKWKVYHFMMGKGKSSILTPLLVCKLGIDNVINVVVPNHLIKQTHRTLLNITEHIKLNINVFDDVEIKKIFLAYSNGTVKNDIKKKFINGNIENAIYLIDEFDYMCNPLQSNFNLIKDSNKFTDYALLNDTLRLINNYKIYGTIAEDHGKYSYVTQVMSILKNEDQYIKNVNYGMSVSNIKQRYCIPYARKDSPLEKSSFRSIIITITLTILYFYESNFVLEKNDYLFIISKKMINLINNLSRYYECDAHEFTSTNIDKLYEHIRKRDELYKDEEDRKTFRYGIFVKYIEIVLNTILISTSIQNCSFYDILNINSKFQIGYTGTVNLLLPKYNVFKYSDEVVKDNDEILGTYYALTGKYSNSINKFHILDDTNHVFDIMQDPDNNYDTLIDACAFLKDLDNSKVAERLGDIFPSKIIIYLTKDDIKMMYRDHTHSNYDERTFYDNEVVYYYSHRHIIGIDFVQPNRLNGLILLNKKNSYTEIAQAIFRMRKLNRGHRINIGYCGFDVTKKDIFSEADDEINKKNKVYIHLIENDLKFKMSVNDLAKFQIMKCLYRKYMSRNYTETFLKPLYSYEIEGNDMTDAFIDGIIQQILSKNIFNFDKATIIEPYDTFIDKIIRKEVIKIYAIREEQIYKTELIDIVVDFLHFKKSNMVHILFDINSTETQEEMEQEREQEKEQIKIHQYDEYDDVSKQMAIKFWYDPKSRTENKCFEWCRVMYNGINIIFSVNLFMIFEDIKLEYCIIRLNENTFLIENIYNVFNYQTVLPIYDFNGFIVNELYLNDDVKFSTPEYPFQLIDLLKLFDFKVIIDSCELYMSNIIGGTETTGFVVIDDGDTKENLLTIYTILHKYGTMINNSRGLTDYIKGKYYRPTKVINLLRSYNYAEYEDYIRPHIVNCMGKTIKTNMDLKYDISYPCKLTYLYDILKLVNSGRFEYFVRFNVDAFLHMTGGKNKLSSNYALKYAKYLNKLKYEIFNKN